MNWHIWSKSTNSKNLKLTAICKASFGIDVKLSPAGIYVLKVNNGNKNDMWNIFKVIHKANKTASGVFNVNFENTLHILPVIPLLTLNK